MLKRMSFLLTVLLLLPTVIEGGYTCLDGKSPLVDSFENSFTCGARGSLIIDSEQAVIDACNSDAACTGYDYRKEGNSGYICLLPASQYSEQSKCCGYKLCQKVVDYCAKNTTNCHGNATCTNTDTSYMCNCTNGFHGNGTHCTENCATNDCHLNATCTATNTSYMCNCTKGFYGNGTHCTGNCAMNNCDGNAICTATDTSYMCNCTKGFYGNGTHCRVDYCAKNTTNCHANATCTNTDTSYMCNCTDGFHGNGTHCTGNCATNDCHANATCTATDTSYMCNCTNGFYGNGTHCTGNCATNDCDARAICTATDSSYMCNCTDGFYGNGTYCTDVDECKMGDYSCHQNASCVNTIGGYNCSCNYGFAGNGSYCEASCSNVQCPADESCSMDVSTPRCDCNKGFYRNSSNGRCSLIERAFKSQLQMERNYTQAYNDSNSPEFKSLAATIETTILPVLQKTIPEVVAVEVYSLKEGSVIAEFNIILDAASRAVNETQVQSALQTAVVRGNFSELSVNTSVVPKVQVYDKCQTDATNDCHNLADCIQNEASYTCKCKTGFVGDGFNCTVGTVAPTSANIAAFISLTCHEMNMTAVVNENQLIGRIFEIKLEGCDADKYTVYGNNTISTNFKDCVQNITEDGREIIQENVVAVSAGQRNSIIERIAWYYFKLQCKFDRFLRVTHAGVINVGSKVQKYEVTSLSNFSAIMTFYKTESFFQVADSPLQVAAYEPIYVQITGQYNNTLFKFVTEQCYATPSENAGDTTRYLFFGDKCGIDNTFEKYNSGSSNKFSFSIHAFRFIRLKQEVFFHCTLLVCKADTDSEQCSQACTKLKRKRRGTAEEDDVGRITIHTGAVQHQVKPTCQRTSCPTNTYCVDLFPAICRCNDGFVLNLNTNQCSNENLVKISGLHLDIEFRRPYLDTSSLDFIRLAKRVETELMASYALDKGIIYGAKVISARKGSVVLDIQLTYAKSVTPKEAFDSFMNSVFKSEKHSNVLRIKQDIIAQFDENTKSQMGITTVLLVAIIVALQLVVVLVIFLIVRNRRNKRKLDESTITNVTKMDDISS